MSSISRSMTIALAWAAGETESSAASMTVRICTRASFSRSLPPMIRDTSRMSSISCDWASALLRMTPIARSTVALSLLPD